MDSNDKDTDKHLEHLTREELRRGVDAIDDFVNYVSSPWRMIWTNFVAGVLRGIGAILGASVFIAALLWVLSLFVNVPLIGQFFEEALGMVNQYIEQQDYTDEINRLGDSLERLEGAILVVDPSAKTAVPEESVE